MRKRFVFQSMGLLVCLCVFGLAGIAIAESDAELIRLDPNELAWADPNPATASSFNAIGYEPARLFDNSGMSGETWIYGNESDPSIEVIAPWPDGRVTHADVHTRCWINNQAEEDDEDPTDPLAPWVMIDLGQSYDIGRMEIWNYANAGQSQMDRGTNRADIEYSSDGTNWTTAADDLPIELCITSLDYGNDVINPTIFNLNQAARFVRLSNLQGPRMFNDVALGEVRFYTRNLIPTAINLIPNMGIGIPVDENDGLGIVEFSWEPDATSGSEVCNLIIGTDPNLTGSNIVINNVTSPYEPASGLLDHGTVYYWRIDTIDPGTDNSYIATFTSVGKTSNPVPFDDDISISPQGVSLNWRGDALGGNYKVLFGTTSGSLAQIGIVASPAELLPIGPNDLDPATTYYWRVEELNDSNVAYAPGDEWSFTTGDLVGEWLLSGNATDTSGYGNNGTISGATNNSTSPLPNALQFDGLTNNVTISGSESLNPYYMSIALWVNPNEVEYPEIQDVLARCSTTGAWGAYAVNTEPNVHSIGGGFSKKTGGWTVAKDLACQNDEWQFYVFTYDGNTHKSYRNGELRGVSTSALRSPVLDSGDKELTFGVSFQRALVNLFWGGIDDVRIYGYAINAATVESLYNQAPTTVAKDAVPASGTVNVAPSTELSWTAGKGAASHNLKVGTGVDPNTFEITGVFIDETGLTSTTYTPASALPEGTKLYWQVNESDGIDVLTGNIWSLTTYQCSPIPVGDLTGDCVVNLADFAILAADWLQCNRDPITLCP